MGLIILIPFGGTLGVGEKKFDSKDKTIWVLFCLLFFGLMLVSH